MQTISLRKAISLRRAKPNDFEVFKKLNDYDYQLLYSRSDSDKNEELSEEAKKIIEYYALDTRPSDPRELFDNNMKNMFIIEVDEKTSGYICVSGRKNIKITDMAISDFSICGELYLSRILHCLSAATKADSFWLFCFNKGVAGIFRRIGFTVNDCFTLERKNEG